MKATTTLLMSVLAIPAGVLSANPLAPKTESFSDDVRQRVIAEDAAMSEEARRLEIQESCVTDEASEIQFRGAGVDNDGCHYARGSTMICHVFVNHDGGTWSFEERNEAGAKAAEARQHFLNWAPTNAYMSFDHETIGGYYYYTADLPYDVNDAGYFETYMVDDAAADIGFNDSDGDGSRIDQMTTFLQNWDGGWDNVILVFQPADYHFNPATASYGTSWTRLGVDHSSSVWAHEWGHLYGACDEYSTADCNGLYCPDICQSWYLTDQVPNGNCEVSPCVGPVNCLMRYNWTGSAPCQYTQRNWAWTDDNGNGLLDVTRRWDADQGQLEDIWNLFHNGWHIASNEDRNFVANQRWTSWSAMGVRSRGASNWAIQLYGENNHQHHLASSFLNGDVEFVVGDFNHNNLGEDHISLLNTGGNGQYVLGYEAGNGMLFADGVERTFSWNDYNVVRAYDLPLVGGETVIFQLDPGPQQNLGMALFKSDGDTYYADPLDAEFLVDDWGASINEAVEYTVPETDVYGFVIWSDTEVDADFSIKIGPTLATLGEATPFTSFLDLRLFQYSPYVPYWAITAVRPGASTNVRLQLYEESTFETVLGTSGAYPNVEFIAADYGDVGVSTDYLRVAMQSGNNGHTTEWEQGADLLTGFDEQVWDTGHVAKIWDAYMEGGQTYMIRQYEWVFDPLDIGVYVVSSADGDPYKQRSGAEIGSNSGAGGGEWLHFTPADDDFYGVALIAHDDASDGEYTMAFGPRITLVDDAPRPYDNEVVFGDFTTIDDSWCVVAVRAEDPAATVDLDVWTCQDYGIGCYEDGDHESGGVELFVVDGNHHAPTTFFPRGHRMSGTGMQNMQSDSAPANDIAFDDPDEVETVDAEFLGPLQVVHAWDLFVGAAPIDVKVTVTPLDGAQDLGVAIFSSEGGNDIQGRDEALVAANTQGPGTSETVSFNAPVGEVYGLIVTNENGVGGAYRIEIRNRENTVDVPVAGIPNVLDFRARGAVGRSGLSTFEVDLPDAGPVELVVFDLQGRRVRSLVAGELGAGTHEIAWDGRSDAGSTGAGVYFARLDALGERRSLKLVRLD